VFIVFYIFSVIGMNLFGDVDTTLERFDFETFASSIYTLFLSATGDSWNVPFAQCMVEGNLYVAVVFWVFFFLIGALVMINLFIGVVLESFQENLDDDMQARDLISVRRLVSLWNAEDRKASGFITAHEFWRILLRSPYPAGFTLPLSKDGNKIEDVALKRFLKISQTGKYMEPGLDEVRHRLGHLKIIVHRGYRDPETNQWLLADDEHLSVVNNFTSAFFSLFENEDAGITADDIDEAVDEVIGDLGLFTVPEGDDDMLDREASMVVDAAEQEEDGDEEIDDEELKQRQKAAEDAMVVSRDSFQATRTSLSLGQLSSTLMKSIKPSEDGTVDDEALPVIASIELGKMSSIQSIASVSSGALEHVAVQVGETTEMVRTEWIVKFDEVIRALCMHILGHPLSREITSKEHQRTVLDWWEEFEFFQYRSALLGEGGVVGTEVSLFELSLAALSRKYEKENEVEATPKDGKRPRTLTMEQRQIQSFHQSMIVSSAGTTPVPSK
jgi:hypothetical protein